MSDTETGNRAQSPSTQPSQVPRKYSGLVPFKPGQSGNPSGRPKKTKITDALRQILEEECVKDPKSRTFARLLAERLVKEGVRKGSKSRDAIAAIAEIADRTEGKPAQKHVFGEDGEGISINITVGRVE